jgi:WD40 repeat protein
MSNRFPLAFRSVALAALLLLLSKGEPVWPASAPPSVGRDEQGDPLPGHALRRLGTLRMRSAGGFCSLAWSPDGRSLASGEYEGTARVWDIRTGEHIVVPVDPTGGPRVRFSGDGTVLATAGGSLQFFRWNAPRAPAFRSFKLEERTATPSDLAVSPDGRLAAAGYNGMAGLVVYDVENGRVLWKTHAPRDGVRVEVLAFSPDARLLASASEQGVRDCAIRLWDARTGREKLRFSLEARWLRSLVFTPRGDFLISCASDGVIRFWDVATQEEKRRILNPGGPYIALSADGSVLAAHGYLKSEVRLYRTGTGELLRTLDCGSSVRTVALSPDGRTLATALSRTVRFWDVATGREIRPRPGHDQEVLSVRFSPDGKTVASRSADQTVRLWSPTTGRQQRALSLGNGPGPLGTSGSLAGTIITSGSVAGTLAFSPDGRTLAALEGADKGPFERGTDVLFWELSRPAAPRRVREPAYWPLCIAFSPDGRIRATGTRQHGVHLWNEAGELLAELADPEPVIDRTIEDLPPQDRPPFESLAVAFSADDRTLAVAADRRLLLWDYRRRRHLRTLLPPAGATNLAFSPSGHLVAATGYAREFSGPRPVQVWETATGRPVATLQPTAEVDDPPTLHGLAFSPDGRLLAAGDSQGNVRFWDLATRKQLACCPGHRGNVFSVDFAPDGQTLASGGEDTTVLLWDTRSLRPTLSRSTVRLDDLVTTSSDEDAEKAYAAVWALVGLGDPAVARLRDRLRPASRADADAVHGWIAQLDDPVASRRDEASRALERLGRSAEPWLRRALAGKPSPEAKRRLGRLLRRLEGGPTTALDRQNLRGLLVLELIGTESAWAVLAELARGEPDADLTRAARAACARLARNKR